MGAPSLNRVLPFDKWPRQDQELWQAGLRGGDLLEGEQYASSIRATTLRSTRRGYGRWLAALADIDPSSLLLAPGDRVTPAHVRQFLAALQDCGNSNNTVQARFWQLRSALRVLCPRMDFQWLNKPGGTYLSELLPIALRPRPVVDIRELMQWGTDLMSAGMDESAGRRSELFRNGLLIALFACRAPRQRSMASLRLGRNILRHGDRFQISFSAADMKGGKPLDYFLPDWLVPYVNHYLEAVRPRLLNAQDHDWFWVRRGGGRLAEIGMEGVIRRASQQRFGFKIGAHTFRHSFATTHLRLDPSNPKKVAAILGNSPYVVESHYDFGDQIDVAHKWQDIVDLYVDERK